MALPLRVVITGGEEGTGCLTGVLCTGAACSFSLSLPPGVAGDSGTFSGGLRELGLGLGSSTSSRQLSRVVSRVRLR